ncbi:hypothetical protein PUV54_13550 [Hyphococcus flavus]|uniref:Uncharacterized protein n=1 Tax=Hyphococcus flavus TaxID=1866326 RepID=A0AAE9ZCK5_9PROT|nr:hypothetical protein [Hyphococcus flavus]WDI30980.1 hypothetical protein PUV54_13550 [Hyphococcus flavus]
MPIRLSQFLPMFVAYVAMTVSGYADGLEQIVEVQCVEDADYFTATGKMVSADYFQTDAAQMEEVLAGHGVFTLSKLASSPVTCRVGEHLVKVHAEIGPYRTQGRCITEVSGNIFVELDDEKIAVAKLPSACLDPGWSEIEINKRWIKVTEFAGGNGEPLSSEFQFKHFAE